MSGPVQDNRPKPSSVHQGAKSIPSQPAPNTHGRRGLDLNQLCASDLETSGPASKSGRRWAKAVVNMRKNRS